MTDIIRVVVLSFVEGLTEFIPVSSTGHLIIVNEFIKLKPENFANIFNIIIQLGAIMAVVVLYFHKLNPFSKDEMHKKETLNIWKKVIIGALPAAVLGLLFDDIIDAHLMNAKVVATMLFLWGVVIILIEKRNMKNENNIAGMTYMTAFMIGIFQCFAMIPGTSRSAATIIGAMLLGLSRVESAEFSFFLAIPTMLGATSLKVVKLFIKHTPITSFQVILILLGVVLSFVFALIVIRKFMDYVKNHDFIVFGIYRMILSIVVLTYFLLK